MIAYQSDSGRLPGFDLILKAGFRFSGARIFNKENIGILDSHNREGQA